MKYSQVETPRMILRQWRESDLEDFFHYCKNPAVGPAAGWAPYTDRGVSRNILRSFIETGEVWAIEDRESHRVIGSVGLHTEKRRSDPNCKMLGYVLDDEFWGQGRMPEVCRAVLRYAFETLCLEMVSVYHYPFNNQSRRVIEKCGFHYEGTLRRGTVRYDGAVLDDVCYSMIRSEYEALYKKGACSQTK